MSPGARRAPPWLVLIALPIGFASSLAGIGGGLFAGSLLYFGCGFELKRATGTALVLVLATTVAATATEALQPDSALELVTIAALLPGVLIGAQVGFHMSERLPDRALRMVFAVCLLYAAVRLVLGGGVVGASPETVDASSLPRLFGTFLVGIGGGLATPVLGVGGGMVVVPCLHLLLGLPFDTARACSLAAGCVSSGRSLLLKARVGRVGWRHGLALGAGSLVGASLGVLALGVEERLVDVGRWILALVLGFVGLRYAREVLSGRGGRDA